MVASADPHFVVATGKTTAGDNYLINDPGTRSSSDLSPYGSTYTGMRLFNNDTTAPRSAFLVYAHSPVELLITDPSQRQTGVDPGASISPQDIPGSSYGTFQLADDEDPTNAPPTEPIKEVEILNPTDGRYLVNVIGTGDGPYTLDFLGYDVVAGESGTTLKGTAHAGVTTQYVVNYASAAGSTLQVFSPSLSAVTPGSVPQGSTSVALMVTGTNTNFSASSIVTVSGQGITVSTASTSSATSISATVNVDKAAAIGTHSVTVTTGAEIATGADILSVSAASAPPPPATASGGGGGGGAIDFLTLVWVALLCTVHCLRRVRLSRAVPI
jgi:hypothetical protein